MIGYYVHHQGRGHSVRAAAVASQISDDVVALTSADLESPAFAEVVRLARDDDDPHPRDVEAGGLLHWVPRHDAGLRRRMAQLAQFVDERRPAAMVVDVSVEVALFLRLLGVPVVVMAMPGDRDDPTHRLAYQAADAIIAPWPGDLYRPAWLTDFASKTVFTGGISRFDGRERTVDADLATDLLVVTGTGGVADAAPYPVAELVDRLPELRVAGLGPAFGTWAADPWPQLCSARVVVIGAGMGSIADAAAAGRPAVVLPEDRPYGEQHATAATVARTELALVPARWPDDDQWRAIVSDAPATAPGWSRWQTEGAAARAARVVEAVAAA